MTSAGFRATQVLPTIVTCNSYQVSFHASERSARWYETLTLIIAYHTLHVATRLRRVQVELMIAFRPYCVSMRLDTLNLDAALPKQIRRFFVFFGKPWVSDPSAIYSGIAFLDPHHPCVSSSVGWEKKSPTFKHSPRYL
jgi:hypothetical protein